MALSIVATRTAPRRQITDQEYDHATRDALHIAAASPVARSIIAAEVIVRQLYLVLHGNLENEIKNGFEVANPQLVLDTLGASAQKKATKDRISAIQLLRDVKQTVVPILEIIAEHERQNPIHDEPTQETVLPGSAHGAAGELRDVPVAGSGDAVEAAGLGSQGGSGEEGSPQPNGPHDAVCGDGGGSDGH